MSKSGIYLIVIFAVLLVGAFFFLWTPPPTVSLSPGEGPVSARKEFSITLDAPRAVLDKLAVTAEQGENSAEVLVKKYGSGISRARETFTLAQTGFKDGPLKLRVTATDSPDRFGLGKTTKQLYSFDYESAPPTVAVLSIAHNIMQGGAGLVVYTLSKEVEKTGVIFADRYFPGYRQAANYYAVLFPFPYDMDPNRYIPKVTATDRAGNERVVTINYHLLPKAFPTDRINISDVFLEKVASEFKDKFPQAKTPLEIFLKVNSELRQQDTKTIQTLGLKTSPVPLWQGTFLRMPNAAPLGAYAQSRTYIFHGEKVDQQTHLGIDLASLVHAQVPAANNGKIVHAGDLGIYGQCVIIDHGMGLQTLYGHLSRIIVKTGDNVEKGQIIGNTGATGMAAGDHLHYSVMISGEQVNPIEWWDPSWIRNNITSKLEMGKTLK